MRHPQPPNRPRLRRGPIVALVLIVVLILAGELLSRLLGGAARLQDCVLSGRSDCSVPEASPGRN